MDIKKLFVFLLLGLFMISFASAFEFDNVKSYDPVAREITITNAYGLGADIGKARLNTPINVRVGQGYQMVAEFDLWAYQDYNDALKQLSFEDMKSGRLKINRDYDLKYKSFEDVEINDYKYICNEKLKGVVIDYCDEILIGSHIERKDVWKKITPADLKKNDVLTIGVFTEVQAGDYIDWIPMIYGVEIDEWATWTEDLNADILSYWTYNIDGEDNLSVNDAVLSSVQGFVAGKILNGVDLEAGASDYITLGGGSVSFTSESFTYNTWIKLESYNPTWAPGIIGGDGNNVYGWYFQDAGGVNGKFAFGKLGVDEAGVSDTSVALGTWTMITITYDQSANEIVFYINGQPNGTHAYSTEFSAGNIVVGKKETYYVDGVFDEMGAWGRVLTPAEILNNLYNEDNGNTYEDEFDLAPIITLNSPTVDVNYTSVQSLTFNFTASDDQELSDVKLYVNDILNQTNATGINNSVYLFDLDLIDGDYTIYGQATDNESQTTNSSSIRIVIDSTVPVLTAYNLTDQTTFTLPINSSWNYTATDTHIDSCYYNTTANATQTVITCNASIITSWTTGGNKTLTYCANDTFGFETCKTDYVYVYYLTEAQGVDLDPTVEGNSNCKFNH